MQHDHVLKKFNFDLLTASPGWGGGEVGGYHVSAFVIPFNLICKMIMIMFLDLLTPSPDLGGGGGG